jgi:hypothetical protein
MQNMTMASPPGWVDKSMLILSAPGPARSGITANMVVTRDVVPPGLPDARPLRMHALLDKQTAEMRERMARFQERWRNVDDHHPVAEILIDWQAPQGAVAQWVTFADLGDGALMVATATCGRDEFDDHAPIFRQMLQSLSLPQ